MTTDEFHEMIRADHDQFIGLLSDVLAELREANESLDAIWLRSMPWWVRWAIRHKARHEPPPDEVLMSILAAAHRADEEDRPNANPMQGVLWKPPED